MDLICRLDFTNGQHNNLNSSWNTGPGQESPFVIYFNDQIELDNNKIVGKNHKYRIACTKNLYQKHINSTNKKMIN